MKLFFVLSLLGTILLSSCKDDCMSNQDEIRALMKDWYRKEIIFPTDMEVLMDSSVINIKKNNANISTYKRNVVVHFFTADCDKCVNELSKIQSFLQKIDKDEITEFMFIASAPTKIYVLEAIRKIKFAYPIYYEKHYNSFKTINQLPLADDLYNTMLLNNKREVILFGAFYDNKKAQRLFFKATECSL